MNISNGVLDAYNNSRGKGFRDMEESILTKMMNSADFTQDEFLEVKSAFRGRRLMLIVSELSEALEAERKCRRVDSPDLAAFMVDCVDNDDRFHEAFKQHIKDTYEDELADAVIRIFDKAGGEGIDLESHVIAKMRFNAGREKMHGKKF